VGLHPPRSFHAVNLLGCEMGLHLHDAPDSAQSSNTDDRMLDRRCLSMQSDRDLDIARAAGER
jgi:hypothetical protein